MDNYEYLIDGIGLWSEVLSKNDNIDGKPALFLDRDGTIVKEQEYLHEPKNVKLNKNISYLINACNIMNIPVIEITNQSGIGRGYYSWNDFIKTEQQIRKFLLLENAKVDMLCACAFHSDALGKYKVDNHSWRKPNIGMLLQAKNSLNINLNDSWIIGDRISDIRAGENAGIKGGVYLNAKNNKHVSKSNFILKYKDNLDDLNWLIDDLSNSCF
jgi:D-glycero-D-manno-heptose 1,7-bisphosphate phosphatase|tara:strand:- start:935 stop:1576 length:642 start_codon:yes stop_codon:yes gene_type:complete